MFRLFLDTICSSIRQSKKYESVKIFKHFGTLNLVYSLFPSSYVCPGFLSFMESFTTNYKSPLNVLFRRKNLLEPKQTSLNQTQSAYFFSIFNHYYFNASISEEI